MKKYFFIFLLFSIFSFSSESIKELNVNVIVNENGSLDIIEKITYNPGDLRKHGIYRVLPYRYKNGSYFKFEDRIAIKDFKVRYIEPLDETVKYVREKDKYFHYYRLGSENKWLKANNSYTYLISYRLYNVLRQKDNISQIYFNPIGHNWNMPIEKASFKISGINGDIQVFTGKIGQTLKNYKIKDGNFISTKILNENEGMSFLLNSKDFKYSLKDKYFNRLQAYPSFFVGILIIIISIIVNIVAFKIKFKNRIKKKIIPIFDLPNTSPVMAKYIDNNNDYSDLMIVIFMLVSKGIIKYREKNPQHENEEYVIRYGEKRNIKKKGYQDYVEKVYYIDIEEYNKINKTLSVFEKKAIDKLMLSKNNIFKKEKLLARADKNLKNMALKRYYKEYVSLYESFLFFYILGIASIFIINLIYFKSIDFFVIIILLVAILTSFNILSIKKYSSKYEKEYLEIKGFKKFLQKVEAKYFERFNDTNDIVKYFKDILPYALALGLENRYMLILNSIISKFDLDKEYVYETTMYYYLYDRYIFNSLIQSSYSSLNSENKTNYTSSSFSGGFSSSGSSGQGFGGGGGHSW